MSVQESKKADTIKDIEDIKRIKNIFISNSNKTNDRHLLYFTFGLNTCFKPGELLSLKWTDIMDVDNNIIKEFINYNGYKFYLNLSCKKTLYHYIKKYDFFKTDTYIFGGNKPMVKATINRTYGDIEKALNLKYNLCGLSLHKTFIYWQIKEEHNDYIKMSKLKELYSNTEKEKSINVYADYRFKNDYIYINNINL